MTDDRRQEPVSVLSGVGPQRQAQLEKLGLRTLGDLLHFYPRGYEDRRTICPVFRLQEGVSACVRGVVALEPRSARLPGGRVMARTHAFDDTGMLDLTFFNNPYLRLERGGEYIFFGKPVLRGGHFSMVNPSVERADAPRLTGKLLPLYPLTGKLTQPLLRSWVAAAVERCGDAEPELIPPDVVERWQLCSPQQLLQYIHTPQRPDEVQQARRRILFEQLFYFCLAGRRQRSRGRGRPSRILDLYPPEIFYASLPFLPTQAQTRAVVRAYTDLCRGTGRMNRLLQGDVGSGKTLVAAACMWLAWKNRMQSLMMAPTELLARQHQQTLQRLLGPFGVPVELLVSNTPAARRRDILEDMHRRIPMVLCGTQALIQKGLEFPDAVLVVVDEQHRFGVAQRAELMRKTGGAHLLTMSATPIPRTLNLILYGDLEVSVLDELPPGRQPVKTFAVTERKRQGMYGFLQKEVDAGGQAYIVCPMVEDGEEENEKKSAVAYAQQLHEILPRLRIGLMHGRLPAAEKEAVMAAFAAGETDVLVSTTVIEVGVDVPRATVMIIENADYFGLSQLHQLRGRVGRGQRQSWCFLMHNARSEIARERLRVLCDTNDGFRIAETDLRLRGPGDFFGQRQSGLPDRTLAEAAGESKMVEAAQHSAETLWAEDPGLRQHPLLAERVDAILANTIEDTMN